ncbi:MULTISPECIES: hypothetical protein [unclassified Microbacterium]|uniref:hypothetical protein n=1 Tax=unclassified Microbacterium TaxID=2609290 RepID=UPI0016051FE4|nr:MULTISPECIES: hypothetical protein [unclassified Microbacterium]QNA93163.1 hypothetical protein G4G29_14045 [Microbacterium sp. Se63.02b]QYM63360.1 hypothetical protein K1X59_14100 [Microbacterium sp. Se5.02b]
MTEETAADARVRRSVTRTLVVYPLLGGAVLLLAAIAVTLAGDDLGFFPFLFMLVSGLCFGFAFVNATLGMVPARNGAILHVAVAVVLGALVAFVVEFGGDLLEPLPESVRGVAVVLQMAAIPAVGWIWLGVIGRITDLFSRRDAKKRPAPVTPAWERDESGDGSIVHFPGLELRMRVLTQAIVAIVVVVGAFAVVLLIAFDDIVMRMGARIAIILMGVVLGLPAYLLFAAILRRRTASCSVAFGDDELRVRVDAVLHTIPYREMEYLRWRTRSDYARIEVRGAGADLSLIAGLAKPPRGLTAELPALPRRVFRRFELVGLAAEKKRRDEVVTFRRAVGAATRPGTPAL